MRAEDTEYWCVLNHTTGRWDTETIHEKKRTSLLIFLGLDSMEAVGSTNDDLERKLGTMFTVLRVRLISTTN